MAVLNPFRLRYTEQQRDHVGFLRTFGAEMLEILPPAELAWDRLVVLRSAPGAGKTSILRLLTPESVRAILETQNPDEVITSLRRQLERLGVVSLERIARLGILINVGDDYRSLIDLGPGGAGNRKIFLRLLDARILIKTVEAVLSAVGLSFPQDAHRITLTPRPGRGGDEVNGALAALLPAGSWEGPAIDGRSLLSAARQAEREVLTLIDSLMPVEWDAERGHSRLYSLQVLSNVSFSLDDRLLGLEPALLVDDVHDLASVQRELLFAQLLDRSNRIGRWIAERKEAVPDHELLVGQTEGRELTIVTLEDELVAGHRGGATNSRMQRILGNIANARSVAPLSAIGITDRFVSLLPEPRADLRLDLREVVAATRAAAIDMVSDNPQYRPWLDVRSADEPEDPLEAAASWRELAILIARDLNRSPTALFDLELDPVRMDQLSSAATRAAARLFVAHEYKLPYYAGADAIADLASRNVEQYLGLGGDLFELIVSAATLGRRGQLTPDEQDKRVRNSSRRLWTEVSSRVPYGPDVLALLHVIADRGRAETYRPTAPYAPGVTGTAVDARERYDLFGSGQRAREVRPEYRRLARALSSAVANNLLEMSAEPTRTKGRNFAVFYLNRLLCPHFGLPLGRGGFREQPASQLARRLEIAVRSSTFSAVPDPDTQLSELEGWPA